MAEVMPWQPEPTPIRVALSYNFADQRALRSLIGELQKAVSAVFAEYSGAAHSYGFLRRQETSLLTAINSFDMAAMDQYDLRHHALAIEKLLNNLTDLLTGMQEASNEGSVILAYLDAVLLTNKARRLSVQLRRVSENAKPQKCEVEVVYYATPARKGPQPTQFELRIGTLSPEIQELFVAEERQASLKKADENTKRFLSHVSPDLLNAYKETKTLAAKALNTDGVPPEDQLFIERIDTDFLPQMFSSLYKAGDQKDSRYWETLVKECLEQFSVLQAALNDIMERAFHHEVRKMQSQTEFLHNKVHGNSGTLLELTNNSLKEGR